MNFSAFKEHSYSTSPHFLLIGNPVAHSLSPLMHNTAARYYHLPERYHAVRVGPKDWPALASYLNNEQLKGMNVTIPYKRLMLDYADELDAACRKIGALNTIVKDNYRLVGFNTDSYGFCKPLDPYAGEIEGGRAIIFGTGGAARAITFGLIDLGIEEMIIVSRNPQKQGSEDWPDRTKIVSYDAWSSFAGDAVLMINATPLGMNPNREKSAVKESEVSLLAQKICYDIVYSPRKTTFLKQAEAVNARTIGGLEMLIHQGSRSFKLWTGKPFPINIVREKLNTHLNDAD